MTRPPARALEALDPKTLRRYRIGLSRAVEFVDNAPLFGAIIAEVAHTIGREWVHRYAVPFPRPRIVWSVVDVDAEEAARRLAEASAVHDHPAPRAGWVG